MVKKALIFFPFLLLGGSVVCQFQAQKIICTYFINRSDNDHGLEVRFHWYSPNGKDDRIRTLHIPPYYGSVYDYRFIPGRVKGRWLVEVKELDSNKTAQTYFDINSSSDDFFED